MAQEEKEAEKEKDKVDMKKITCPLSGGPINVERFVEYKGAKVYFCCEKCPVAFEKDPKNEKFAAKVNYQILATKQATQQACPLSGQKLNKETAVEVGYAKVPIAFCCENCQGKVTDMQKDESEEAQVKLIAFLFGDEKKFAKAFKIGEEKEGEEKEEAAAK
jgi:YHS domain-containing protein